MGEDFEKVEKENTIGKPLCEDVSRPLYEDVSRPLYEDVSRPLNEDVSRPLNEDASRCMSNNMPCSEMSPRSEQFMAIFYCQGK